MKEKLGRYDIIRQVGTGGMGEVLLAYDSVCERNVALKRIRTDLKNREAFKRRFLHEAKTTASLTHPGIITIYSIVAENDEIYYTMPYVEGKTFKALLKESLPIPQLLPIFKTICQTVAYAHSRGIIHRDLKPENVLVGNFGEVIILDWGLAESLTDPSKEEDVETHPELTHPGKIVGTLAYMAPERALANPATKQTDVYALGVMLYLLLTLHLPFDRGTLKEFRKNYAFEKLVDPEEIAPYREVPISLSHIAKKALSPDTDTRYASVDLLLHDLLNHMEGRSEWFARAELDVKRKSDWEFQENVLITKHMAITPGSQPAEWVSLMLSKLSFSENTRMETQIYIKKEGAGVGILLSVPEAAERAHPFDGYCLWLGTEEEPSSRLFRNTVEVMHLPDLFLKKERWHHIVIEKIDNDILFTLDHTLCFKYVSYLPLSGTHVGLLSRDDAFDIDTIRVSIGSHHLQVSCLAIGDAFLTNGDYKKALAEYRRIGNAFPGHAEGREALFRAGVTLLEEAKNEKSVKKAEKGFQAALEEFARLHKTPGAPLEYLGKALVYEALDDHDEEIKCYDLALRRYPKHPLLPAIKEQLIYRMHESASHDRWSAYRLILIALRHLPEIASREDSKRLFKELAAHAEPLPFVENPLDPETLPPLLAFWVANPYLLLEILEETKKEEASLIGNILYFLFELGAYEMAIPAMERLPREGELEEILTLLQPLAICHQESLEAAIEKMKALKREDIGLREWRTWNYLLTYALHTHQEKKVEEMARLLVPLTLSREDRIALDSSRIWAFLALGDYDAAGKIFDTYSFELLNQESTLLHTLYGCYLSVTENEEIAKIHFGGVIETPFPRSWALLSHELTTGLTQNPAWIHTSFMLERRELHFQLELYYRLGGDRKLADFYHRLALQEGVAPPEHHGR